MLRVGNKKFFFFSCRITLTFAFLQVARSDSWWAKKSAVEFLQVFIFRNMFTVLSDSRWTKETTDIVLEMLEDDRVEVREKAAEVLGGLLHCDFISDTAPLLVTKRFLTDDRF